MPLTREEIGQIFLAEAPALYRYALRMTGSPQDSEEAVARTALRCLENAEKFAGQSKVRTWLFGILHNVIREMRREGWREEPIGEEPYPPDDQFSADGHPVTSAPMDAGNAEEILLRKESADEVRAQIDRLPPLQRSAFHLRYIEEWDPEEICNALGITNTHLRVLLHRARLHLRDRLVAWAKGEGT
ncbi:MAG: sigma-70 family RNA polymerase sigma factor [Nitrospirae bacterium]|nr:sigma-70 family RNA polymerase sigma factor [Nitrospirota bacterium]